MQGYWWSEIIMGVNPLWSLTVKGLQNIDPQKAYVIVANHQSLADIVMVYRIRRQFRWVAKDSLFRIPIFGWCMVMMNYIRLVRGEYSSVKNAYRQAALCLQQGVSVLFFPEGTRSTTGQMNPFKNGAFKLAIEAKVPIVPIRIEGTADIIRRGDWIFKEKADCRLTVLPPIDTQIYTPQESSHLKEKVRQILIDAAS